MHYSSNRSVSDANNFGGQEKSDRQEYLEKLVRFLDLLSRSMIYLQIIQHGLDKSERGIYPIFDSEHFEDSVYALFDAFFMVFEVNESEDFCLNFETVQTCLKQASDEISGLVESEKLLRAIHK